MPQRHNCVPNKNGLKWKTLQLPPEHIFIDRKQEVGGGGIDKKLQNAKKNHLKPQNGKMFDENRI